MIEQLPVKNWRQIRKMTQVEVADRLGVNPKTVIRWEKEDTELSNLTIYALAKLYEIEIDQIKV
ncbi:helix-turn-helix transcriptional regulator [Mammaliicoccus sciuri]|uniref:helix-turn-helix transcriptional regulator n=1 Tax=Mammaliicoccus sciuri TaxID=1296 RepID=UPI000EC0AA49|nr:helix-turn-helix transcriptional regulator [Mammaliicoccus sciuri]MBO3080329.1 helix-turn-helix transcriptional regulator [Mammaliicoccus sciuri]HCW36503.1 XRE family transcriptional regulator [Staphylococcus sp.]